MNYNDIQEIAIIYGKKELILEFLEKFEIDRMHDGATINAVLVEGDMKPYLKRFIWKGD